MKTMEWATMNGVMLFKRPDLLSGTRHVVWTTNPGFRCPGMLVWSLEVARILFAFDLSGVTFAAWHDDRVNCSTWTDAAGCRCEIDP